MYRATTPKHTFIFEVDPDENYEQILITYAQDDKIILEKTKNDLSFEEIVNEEGETEYAASLELSQVETNMFHAGTKKMVDIQVRVLTYAGEALASDEKHIPVKRVLNDEVLL